MADDDTPRIEPRENGPYMVRGLADMRAPDGSTLDCKTVMALCRCGRSSNKPFCDGTHGEAGFTVEPQGDDASGKVYTYKGERLTIRWNSLTCSHAAKCVATSKDAFDPKRKPWIDANQPEDVLKAACAACPSGALSWGEAGHGAGDGCCVRIAEDGPLEVLGLELRADVIWPEASTPRKYVLCRCGASKNKPFCDGSHADVDWDGSLA